MKLSELWESLRLMPDHVLHAMPEYKTACGDVPRRKFNRRIHEKIHPPPKMGLGSLGLVYLVSFIGAGILMRVLLPQEPTNLQIAGFVAVVWLVAFAGVQIWAMRINYEIYAYLRNAKTKNNRG